MKKIATLAVLAAASAASFAQSSVTLFGVVDATVQVGRGSASNNTGLGNGGNASSRLGFRGTEDLGGGLKAGFWLESGFNNDDGTSKSNNFGGSTPNNTFGTASGTSGGLTFARRATVSLIGDSWGEIRLGRDFSTQYLSISAYDPFGDVGVGATLLDNAQLGLGGPATVRVGNSASYITPNFGGFYGQVQAYRGEQGPGANKKDGNGYGARAGYKNGPLDVALSYAKTDYASSATDLRIGDIKTWTVGASYDLGVASLMAVYRNDKVDNSFDPKGKGYLIGGKVPVGAGEIRASWSRYEREATGIDAKADKFALGYVHNLSKRTALYTTLAYVKNKGGAGVTLNGASLSSANDNSKGLDIGLRHAF